MLIIEGKIYFNALRKFMKLLIYLINKGYKSFDDIYKRKNKGNSFEN